MDLALIEGVPATIFACSIGPTVSYLLKDLRIGFRTYETHGSLED
jgi:hypothetical protein